jgi:SAM-dependent methyltransferase
MRSRTPDELNREQIKIRDQEAATYTDWYIEHVGKHFDLTERETVLDWLSPKEDDIVLDAGCGVGRYVLPLSQRCQKIYAVDFSPQSIAILNHSIDRDRLTNVETLIGDITQPIQVPEQVDKVVSVGTIQHIPTDAARRATIKNLSNVLKKDGRLVFTVWNYFPRKLKYGILGRAGEQEYLSKKDHDEEETVLYCYKFLPAEVGSMLEDCGFTDIRLGGCNNVPRTLSKLTGRHLVPLDIALSKIALSTFLGAYLIARATKCSSR